MSNEFDIVIVGGGLVGLSLAKAIAELPLRIAIIEASTPSLTCGDTRSIALSYGSQQILNRLNVWEKLAPFATPINQIHVSDKGHFGITRLSAKRARTPALGYVIEHGQLQKVLQENIASAISFICPARVQAMQYHAQQWTIECTSLTDLLTLQATLVIAADGDNSTIRQLQGIATIHHDYQHSGLVTDIGLNQTHENTAYERFTPHGPLALLPLSGQRCGLVWSMLQTEVNYYLQMMDGEFLQCLQKEFGYRLGRFVSVGQRYSYPLKLQYAKELIRPGLVLLGNAAHSLHPVAAQGFNLGLRDSACLAQVLKKAVDHQQDLSDFSLLKYYAANRHKDQYAMRHFTHGLARLFNLRNKPTVICRNISLLALDFCPALQLPLLRYAMGMSSKQGLALC